MSELPVTYDAGAIMEQVIIKGDLSKLQPIERAEYYNALCNSIGLNPLTKPFEYITLNGRLTLYALKGATDQLRRVYGVSITAISTELQDDLMIVTATATDKSGRTDVDVGAVNIANLRGDARANAIMKAITKAKRRVTLSLCGLGMLDETEVETIPNAQPARAIVQHTEEAQPEAQEPIDYCDHCGAVVNPAAAAKMLERYKTVLCREHLTEYLSKQQPEQNEEVPA